MSPQHNPACPFLSTGRAEDCSSSVCDPRRFAYVDMPVGVGVSLDEPEIEVVAAVAAGELAEQLRERYGVELNPADTHHRMLTRQSDRAFPWPPSVDAVIRVSWKGVLVP